MLLKRGQLTIFIIIGILIVIGIISYFLLNIQRQGFQNPEVDLKYSILKEDFIGCYFDYSKNLVDFMGVQGGYYDFHNGIYYEETDFFSVPYYYNEGKINYPSIDFISNEISKAIYESLENCFNELDEQNDFFELDFNIGKTTTIIEKDFIKIKTDSNLVFSKDNKKVIVDLKEHSILIDSNIYSMHKLADLIMQNYKQDSSRIDIAGIHEIADENNLYISISNFRGHPYKTIIQISDESEFSPSDFLFLNKYSNGGQ